MKKLLQKIVPTIKQDKWYILSSAGLLLVSSGFYLFSMVDSKQISYSSAVEDLRVDKDAIPSVEFVNRVNNIENVFSELNYDTSLSEETDSYVFVKLSELMNMEYLSDQIIKDLGYKISSSELDKFKDDVKYKVRKDISSAESMLEESALTRQANLDFASNKLAEEGSKKITEKDISNFYEENKEKYALGNKVSFKVSKVETIEEAEALKKQVANGQDLSALDPESLEAQLYTNTIADAALREALLTSKEGDVLIVDDLSVQSVYQILTVSENTYLDLEDTKESIKNELVYKYVQDKLTK